MAHEVINPVLVTDFFLSFASAEISTTHIALETVDRNTSKDGSACDFSKTVGCTSRHHQQQKTANRERQYDEQMRIADDGASGTHYVDPSTKVAKIKLFGLLQLPSPPQRR